MVNSYGRMFVTTFKSSILKWWWNTNAFSVDMFITGRCLPLSCYPFGESLFVPNIFTLVTGIFIYFGPRPIIEFEVQHTIKIHNTCNTIWKTPIQNCDMRMNLQWKLFLIFSGKIFSFNDYKGYDAMRLLN